MMESWFELMPVVVALIATGVIAGILSGLLGVGGGIVIVPVLFFLFQSFDVSAASAMTVATATSLATIIPTSISSITAHRRKNNVDFHLVKRLGLFIFVGVLFGSWLVLWVDGQWFTTLFGIIAVLSALNMMFRSNAAAAFKYLPQLPGQAVLGGGIGFLSVMVGIGGGTLSVPILTAFNYSTHRAVGTAAAIGLIISVPGALTMLIAGQTPSDAPVGTWGLVNMIGFVCIVPLTVLFAPVGAGLAQKLPAQKLSKVFACVLLLTGVRMLLQVIK